MHRSSLHTSMLGWENYRAGALLLTAFPDQQQTHASNRAALFQGPLEGIQGRIPGG